MRLLLLLFAGIIFSFVQVEAAIYEWVDDQGVTNFTDDPDKVPVKFRKRVKTMDSTSEDFSRQPEPKAVSMPSPDPSSNTVSEYGGHNEGWWRSNYANLRAEIKTLQESLPGKNEVLSTLLHKKRVYQTTSDRINYNKQLESIEKDQAKIAELEQKLVNLDSEASRAGVPFEWRK